MGHEIDELRTAKKATGGEETAAPTTEKTAGGDSGVKFSRDIAPILVGNCIGCHNPERRRGKSPEEAIYEACLARYLREMSYPFVGEDNALVAAMVELDQSLSGYQITRLGHSLQSATRAWNDGADIDWVVSALLHDIGDIYAPYNHDEYAATIIRPFVREMDEAERGSPEREAFRAYAATVPLFFPRPVAAKLAGASAGAFSFFQYKKNHEYQAALGYLLLLIALLILWRLRLR